jgi:hypothetical protein
MRPTFACVLKADLMDDWRLDCLGVVATKRRMKRSQTPVCGQFESRPPEIRMQPCFSQKLLTFFGSTAMGG